MEQEHELIEGLTFSPLPKKNKSLLGNWEGVGGEIRKTPNGEREEKTNASIPPYTRCRYTP